MRRSIGSFFAAGKEKEKTPLEAAAAVAAVGVQEESEEKVSVKDRILMFKANEKQEKKLVEKTVSCDFEEAIGAFQHSRLQQPRLAVACP
jgi:hypothetical protein